MLQTMTLADQEKSWDSAGRLLCLAHRDSQQSKCGALMLLECHSTVIKRVCRSTLQLETLSLLAGAEESDHLRFILHGMTHPYKAGSEQWMIEAQDSVNVEWFTDCRSLADHLVQAGLTVVADKRLAIDLCGLRQVRPCATQCYDENHLERLPIGCWQIHSPRV